MEDHPLNSSVTTQPQHRIFLLQIPNQISTDRFFLLRILHWLDYFDPVSLVLLWKTTKYRCSQHEVCPFDCPIFVLMICWFLNKSSNIENLNGQRYFQQDAEGLEYSRFSPKCCRAWKGNSFWSYHFLQSSFEFGHAAPQNFFSQLESSPCPSICWVDLQMPL